jgi:S1-C subfamily serine protease
VVFFRLNCLMLLLVTSVLSLTNSPSATASWATERDLNIAGKPQKAVERLQIQPTDSWQVVSAKAITFRQSGYIEEAIATFAAYGRMFAATDPTAEGYSQIAQKFTRQIESLGVKGGVYIYEVIAGGSAEREGLEVGDIIIRYNDRSIANMQDFKVAKEGAAQNTSLKVVYLRLEGKKFRKYTKTVDNPMKARLMPI